MKKILLFVSILIYISSYAQEDAWVYFTNKPNATTFLANPLTMLSQRAIDRRMRQKIKLDNKDVPIDVNYYNQVKNTNGITVLAKSKWLNAIHVQGTSADIRSLKTVFSFIDFIDFADKSLNFRATTINTKIKKLSNKFKEINTTYSYGTAGNQIEMLKGEFLHQQGYTGKGMYIAILDAGFPNVNNNSGFERLRNNQQILGGYDFVHRNENFYTGNPHGSHVLSNIGGYLEDTFVGTAPDANFYLFITEDVSQEAPIEESLWVEAAERADSLGVDVINTSLGYTTFDRAAYNYTYADMNGKTTFISRGAEIAASRGIILVNAAGNYGRSSWRYISAPADAKGVLSIGAVNSLGNIASFSSRGPTSDNRIKPDVMAQGLASYIINYQTGTPRTANGTSFASPIIAGVITCLWQAFPNFTADEIKNAIRKSADRNETPDYDYGYGIPDFEKAYATLWLASFLPNQLPVVIFPNPVRDKIYLRMIDEPLLYSVTIYSILGKEIFSIKKLITKEIDISFLSKGVYIIQIIKGNKQKIVKLIKQ